jgi:ELWxxDGT repeat protein
MAIHLRLFFQSAVILVTFQITVLAQPAFVAEVPNDSKNFETIGSQVYFTSGSSLWRTDGTHGGTILLKSGFTTPPNSFQEFNNMLFFTTSASELWRSDGTPSGTIKLITTNSIGILDTTANLLFFTARDAAIGQELFRTDGTPEGTALIKDVFPGSGAGFRGRNARVGNHLFFNGDDGTHGFELWKTDGTSGGTVMVKDILPGPGHGYGGNANAFAHNNLFYFSGNTVENGMEPWVSDGTEAGTRLLSDTQLGGDDPQQIQFAIANEAVVYFITHDDKTEEAYVRGESNLWKTDGGSASTVRVSKLAEADYEFQWFRVYRGKVVFFGWEEYNLGGEIDSHLYVTDGSEAGTNIIYSLPTHEGSVRFLEVVNDLLLFYGTAQAATSEFMKSDGTSQGTTTFTTFEASGPNFFPRDVTKIGNRVFYGDHEQANGGYPAYPHHYYQLIQGDGYTKQLVRDIAMTSNVNAYIGSDNITDYNGLVLFTTQNDQSSSTDLRKRLWIYDPEDLSSNKGTFTLVDADTDEDIQVIEEGEVISIPENIHLNIRYDPVRTPGSVRFSVTGAPGRTENEEPFSFAGDKDGDYNVWQGGGTGSYSVTAWEYSEDGAKGVLTGESTVNFDMIRTPAEDVCTASGTILREYWDNVSGNEVSAIPVDSPPTSTSQLTIFEGPTNADTNYGARIRGYICPPTSGDYAFWIASNDHSELWLSTDDDPAKKKRIAYITGATDPRQWDKFPTQKSQTIPLVAGQKYYIEALHKQGVGTDHVAVGWQLPGGSMERPIPGSRLSPADPSINTHPVVRITDPDDTHIFLAPADVPIGVDASDPDGVITNVEFFGGSSKIGEDAEAPYSFVWSDLEPGTYTITAKAIDNAGATTTSSPVTFRVMSGECFATGSITREYWSGVQGSRVSDIPVDSEPTGTHELGALDISNAGTNYGARIRGYVCPPATGYYSFYITSNDHSELWLSPDNDPSKRQKIAYVFGATDPYESDKYPSQVSGPVDLTSGQQYYFEVLHKQGVGTDHLSVAWRRPDGIFEGPIRADYLSPFISDTGSAARMAVSEETLSTRLEQISVYPNPAQSGDAQLSISGYEGIQQSVETQIEIINLTGEVIYAEKISCGGDCGSYLVNINKELVPGVYLVNMKTEGLKVSKRLLVK